MFYFAQTSSNSRLFFRCLSCKSLLFRQDQVSEFLMYDRDDFGKLKQYDQMSKFNQEAQFFVLTNDYQGYSSLRIDYNKLMLTQFHPFFMMHMFIVFCNNCQNAIGYEVQTVNQNTAWMQDRILIDTSKCILLRNGSNRMSELLKIFRSKLANKLQQTQFQSKISSQNQTIENKKGLEHLLTKPSKNLQQSSASKNQPKKQSSKIQLSNNKLCQPSQATLPSTSHLSKNQNPSGSFLHNHSSNFFKLETKNINLHARDLQTQKSVKILQGQIELSNNAYDPQKQISFKHLHFSKQNRQIMKLRLSLWQQKILEEIKILDDSEVIKRILKACQRIEKSQEIISHRIIQQKKSIQETLCSIRRNAINKMNLGINLL